VQRTESSVRNRGFPPFLPAWWAMHGRGAVNDSTWRIIQVSRLGGLCERNSFLSNGPVSMKIDEEPFFE